jgi:hypothetical protein
MIDSNLHSQQIDTKAKDLIVTAERHRVADDDASDVDDFAVIPSEATAEAPQVGKTRSVSSLHTKPRLKSGDRDSESNLPVGKG